jgi:hypothetical protein
MKEMRKNPSRMPMVEISTEIASSLNLLIVAKDNVLLAERTVIGLAIVERLDHLSKLTSARERATTAANVDTLLAHAGADQEVEEVVTHLDVVRDVIAALAAAEAGAAAEAAIEEAEAAVTAGVEAETEEAEEEEVEEEALVAAEAGASAAAEAPNVPLPIVTTATTS